MKMGLEVQEEPVRTFMGLERKALHVYRCSEYSSTASPKCVALKSQFPSYLGKLRASEVQEGIPSF